MGKVPILENSEGQNIYFSYLQQGEDVVVVDHKFLKQFQLKRDVETDIK